MSWTSDEAVQIGRIEAHVEQILDVFEDHERRIRIAEALRYKIWGAFAVLGVAVPLALRYVLANGAPV
jgi:hypothetical protein